MKYAFFAIAFLLLLGCASQAADQAPGTQAQPPAPQQPVPENATPPSPGTTSPSEPANPAPPPSDNKYSGKTFAWLVALDVPLVCEINYTWQGKPGYSKVYMKGGDELRVETVGGAGMAQCSKTISIVRGTRVYVGCEGKMVMPSCDWFRSDYDPAEPGVSSTFNFRDVSPSQILCADWEYSSESFSTPGNSCHL
ncbi:MAG: hypothetical protein AB1324_03840 [Candidatus Micrarchaeota archaeon]